jgi:hypothetical protein
MLGEVSLEYRCTVLHFDTPLFYIRSGSSRGVGVEGREEGRKTLSAEMVKSFNLLNIFFHCRTSISLNYC